VEQMRTPGLPADFTFRSSLLSRLNDERWQMFLITLPD
jgi:hypothetical protein